MNASSSANGGKIAAGVATFFAVGIALGYLMEWVTGEESATWSILGVILLFIAAGAGWLIHYLLLFREDMENERVAEQRRERLRASKEQLNTDVDGLPYGITLAEAVQKIGPPAESTEHRTPEREEFQGVWGPWVLTFVDGQLQAKTRSS